MKGLLITDKGNTYMFRDDHGHDPGIWAWNIHDYSDGDRAITHKWEQLPKRAFVTIFDIDAPPKTVSYVPLMN